SYITWINFTVSSTYLTSNANQQTGKNQVMFITCPSHRYNLAIDIFMFALTFKLKRLIFGFGHLNGFIRYCSHQYFSIYALIKLYHGLKRKWAFKIKRGQACACPKTRGSGRFLYKFGLCQAFACFVHIAHEANSKPLRYPKEHCFEHIGAIIFIHNHDIAWSGIDVELQ